MEGKVTPNKSSDLLLGALNRPKRGKGGLTFKRSEAFEPGLLARACFVELVSELGPAWAPIDKDGSISAATSKSSVLLPGALILPERNGDMLPVSNAD